MKFIGTFCFLKRFEKLAKCSQNTSCAQCEVSKCLAYRHILKTGKRNWIVLYLESEVMRGPGSIPTGGNILSLDFFQVVKSLMPILALLPSFCLFVKN